MEIKELREEIARLKNLRREAERSGSWRRDPDQGLVWVEGWDCVEAQSLPSLEARLAELEEQAWLEKQAELKGKDQAREEQAWAGYQARYQEWKKRVEGWMASAPAKRLKGLLAAEGVEVLPFHPDWRGTLEYHLSGWSGSPAPLGVESKSGQRDIRCPEDIARATKGQARTLLQQLLEVPVRHFQQLLKDAK